jgi:hypothetical protein
VFSAFEFRVIKHRIQEIKLIFLKNLLLDAQKVPHFWGPPGAEKP